MDCVLGEGLSLDDNLLDPISFRELCITVHCNCKHIDKVAVLQELKAILDLKIEDMYGLFLKNMDEIVEMAKEGVSE